MRRIKIGVTLLRIGLLIFVLENFYFGWNETPMSLLEERADYVVKCFVYIGLIFYFMPIWGLYEDYVKRHEQQFYGR